MILISENSAKLYRNIRILSMEKTDISANWRKSVGRRMLVSEN